MKLDFSRSFQEAFIDLGVPFMQLLTGTLSLGLRRRQFLTKDYLKLHNRLT